MKGSDYYRISEAIRFIDEGVEEQPQLADLARRLGLSEYHVHRLFRRWTGITPKDFLQVLTLAKARRLLAESDSVLQASLAVGLSGSGRLHDLFVSLEAITPGQYKNRASGVEIFWSVRQTPLGQAFFAATSRGLCMLSFVDGDPQHTLEEAKKRWPEATFNQNDSLLQPTVDEVVSRMKGNPRRLIALAPKGTNFQVKVWEALLTAPEGSVTTYQKLAQMVGKPQAARAVGGAVAANPIAYLIPCHRVIKATGAVGDYHWGAERKRLILSVEGARQH